MDKVQFKQLRTSLTKIEGGLAAHTRLMASIEARLAEIETHSSRNAETTTRLKLKADNAKDAAAAQAKIVADLSKAMGRGPS